MPIASFTPASLRHSGGNRQRLAANVLLGVLVAARAALLLRRLLRKLRAQQCSAAGTAGTAGGSTASSAVASRAASFLRSLSLRRRQPAQQAQQPQQQKQQQRATPPSLLVVAVADRLLLLDLVTVALMLLALVLLSASLAVEQSFDVRVDYTLYDAANHAKAHMLLTNRAEPGTDTATAALSALAAADSATAAVGAAATVPGGPARWLLPAADAGEVGCCCCLYYLGSVAGLVGVGKLTSATTCSGCSDSAHPQLLACACMADSSAFDVCFDAGFDEFASALAAIDTISTLDTLSSSVQGEAIVGKRMQPWL
jgi:hypothetical protein